MICRGPAFQIVSAALACSFALAQEPVPEPGAADPADRAAVEESYFKGVGRGDVHGPGFAEVLALKGEPLAPRFPQIGDGIERFQLDNGLAVYLAEVKQLPLVSIELQFRGGEAYETEEERGLVNALCERMRRGGIAGADSTALEERLAEQAINLGGRAATETASISVDTLSRHLEEALSIFAEVALRPALERREGDGPRESGFGGGRGGRGGRSPAMVAGNEFRRLVYGENHPLARAGGRFGGGGEGGGPGGPAGPGGRRGNRFEKEQLQAAHARFLRPDNAVLVISGDFESADMAARVRALFSEWRAPEGPLPARVQKEVPPIEGKPAGVYVVDVPGPQSAIVIGHLGVARDQPDRFAITLMNDVLGGGSFASRITERVRSDEGLAYSANSSYPTDGRDAGTFQATVQTKTETTARAVELILEEVEKMRTPGLLSKNEFDTAKESLLYSFGLQFTNRSRNVARLAARELEGRPLDLERTEYEGYRAVTPAAIEAAAAQHLRPQDLIICVAGDLARIRESLAKFGEVHVIEPRGR